MSDQSNRELFKETVWGYYVTNGRALPWRTPEADSSFDPYKILVSELMLQQTQVNRVVPKYLNFIERFPTIDALATASLSQVLVAWSGLGYNRRAKYLHLTAQQLAGPASFPKELPELVKLPGVGLNTAGAILAYAFNRPAVFIETNIRTVYIHHFFNGIDNVKDNEIRSLLEQTIDAEEPRNWYWALMDYGSFIKQSVGNVARSSQRYTKQSAFQGSKRQVRGAVIKLLTIKARTAPEIQQVIIDQRLNEVLSDLVEEKLIERVGAVYRLPDMVQ